MREERVGTPLAPDDADLRAARRELLVDRTANLLAALVLPLAVLLWKVRIWVAASPSIFSGLSLLLVLALLLAGTARLRCILRRGVHQAGPWLRHALQRAAAGLLAVFVGAPDPQPQPPGGYTSHLQLPEMYAGLAVAGPRIR